MIKSPRWDLCRPGYHPRKLQKLPQVTWQLRSYDGHVGARPTNRRVDDVTRLCSLRTVALLRSGRCEMKFSLATRGVTWRWGGGWNASGGCHGDKGQSSRRKGSPPERRSPGVPRWPPDGHLFLQLNLWKFVRIIKISTIFQWKSCWIVMNFWIFHQIGKPARLGGMDLNKFE